MFSSLNVRTYVLLDSGAIGHFVRDYDVVKAQILRFSARTNTTPKVVFVVRDNVSNQYFLDLISKVDVVKKTLFSYIYFRLRRFLRIYNRELWQFIQNKGVDILTVWHDNPPLFLPDKKNISFVQSFLESKVEIKKGLIALVVRDAGYDYKVCANGDTLPIRQLYRNTPIDYLVDSIRFFTSQGFAVVRLGRHSIANITVPIPNYYDYSIDFINHDDRFDVVVPYLSDFMLTSGSGVDELASFFRTPIYRFNLAPVGTTPMSRLTKLVMPQDYVSLDTGKKVPLPYLLREPLNSSHPMKVFSQMNIGLAVKSNAELLAFSQLSLADFQSTKIYKVEDRIGGTEDLQSLLKRYSLTRFGVFIY